MNLEARLFIAWAIIAKHTSLAYSPDKQPRIGWESQPAKERLPTFYRLWLNDSVLGLGPSLLFESAVWSVSFQPRKCLFSLNVLYREYGRCQFVCIKKLGHVALCPLIKLVCAPPLDAKFDLCPVEWRDGWWFQCTIVVSGPLTEILAFRQVTILTWTWAGRLIQPSPGPSVRRTPLRSLPTLQCRAPRHASARLRRCPWIRWCFFRAGRLLLWRTIRAWDYPQVGPGISSSDRLLAFATIVALPLSGSCRPRWA